MEFLYPKTPDDKRIILLLLVHRYEATHAIIYTWGERDNLNVVHPRKFEYMVRSKDIMPTMIVPLTKESSFLIVNTTSMAVYPSSEDSDYRHPTRYPIFAPNEEIRDAPLWIRWARPARNWLYSQNYDGIYLCAEDGWINYLEFDSEPRLETQTSLGQLHCDVDTAFDVLNMGREGGDFILAASSMGDGGLFVQEARDHPKCVQRFLNWAPVTDAAIISQDTHDPYQGATARNRLFATSVSSSGSGAIHEFRCGVEAQLGITVPLDDFETIRDMWTMTDDANGGIYVLLSDPLSTLLLYMNSDLEEGISALDEEQTGLGTAQTIAAGCTPEGAIIQVTENATHLFVPYNLSSNSRIPHEAQTHVLTAAIDGDSSSLVIAVRREGESYLYLTWVVSGDGNPKLDVGQPIKIDKSPVCLSLQKFGDVTFIFMSTVDDTIMVFHVDNQSITYLFETSISVDTFTDISKVVESFATLSYTLNGTLRAFLICGLRSGLLVPFEIDFNASQLIGKTPVGIGSVWDSRLIHSVFRAETTKTKAHWYNVNSHPEQRLLCPFHLRHRALACFVQS